MSWWGKLAGGAFGYMLGGPLGALLGAILGHTLDRGLAALPEEVWKPGDRERVQTAFFNATFSVMGHLAKADGRVSPDEISLAEAVMEEMDLDGNMRRLAIDLFNQGKSQSFSLDAVLQQFRLEAHRRSTLVRMFVEIQLQAAYADGRLDAAEDRVLRQICSLLSVSEFEYRQLRHRIEAERHFSDGSHRRSQSAEATAPSLADAYALLGVSPTASDKEIRKAYRRLISQHHPDKLVSKGLPEEMMKMAAHKTHEIKRSYELIKESREH